jgi:hypothetical protein
MVSSIRDVHDYWLYVVLSTVRTAVLELQHFVESLSTTGCSKCMLIAASIEPTEILSVVGNDINPESGDLDDFNAVKPRLLEALSLISDVIGSHYFGDKTLENVALWWLKDFMGIICDLAQRYHEAVPCTAEFVTANELHKTSLSQRFPFTFEWATAMDTEKAWVALNAPYNGLVRPFCFSPGYSPIAHETEATYVQEPWYEPISPMQVAETSSLVVPVVVTSPVVATQIHSVLGKRPLDDQPPRMRHTPVERERLSKIVCHGTYR